MKQSTDMENMQRTVRVNFLWYVIQTDIASIRDSLYSPTSTSRCITVAQRFGTNDGIVIHLYHSNLGLRDRLATSWISDYGSEDGYLFFTTENASAILCVKTVIIQETSDNFNTFFGALIKLESLFWDRLRKDWMNVSAKEIVIWTNLINYKLGIIENKTYPSYIHDTFHVFTANMIHIRLNLDFMSKVKGNSSWRRLFEIFFVDNCSSNILSRRILQLFPFITLYIKAKDSDSEFCLLSLLREISFGCNKTKLREIYIKHKSRFVFDEMEKGSKSGIHYIEEEYDTYYDYIVMVESQYKTLGYRNHESNRNCRRGWIKL